MGGYPSLWHRLSLPLLPGVSGDFWGSQEGCQGPSRPSGRNRGLPLRRRRGQGPHLAKRWWPRGATPRPTLEAAQGAPRAPRRDSRGERSPWLPLETRPDSPRHFHFSLSCIGEGNGNPLLCSCLENPRDRGAWWVAIYGVAQNQTRLKSFCIPRPNLPVTPGVS